MVVGRPNCACQCGSINSIRFQPLDGPGRERVRGRRVLCTRVRFKERPVLDSLTSSTQFVSPAVVGLTLAGAVLTWSLVLVAFFLWGVAAHAFGAIQDIQLDRKANIHSIATAFGARATARFSLVMWALAGLVMLATEWPGPLAAFLAVPYLVNCAPWWNVTDESSSQTNRAWRRFIWLNYISGLFATLILIMEWNLS